MAILTMTNLKVPTAISTLHWSSFCDVPICRQLERTLRDRLEYLLAIFNKIADKVPLTVDEKETVISLDDNLKILISNLHLDISSNAGEFDLKHIIIKDVHGDITLILE